MKKKTYSEKAKDLCDNFWNDYHIIVPVWNEYQETTNIEYVDKVIKYYIGRFKSLARSADKQIEKLTV